MNNVKVCDKCLGVCELLQPKTRPQSSEWYCPACHNSYPVSGLSDFSESAPK